METDFLAAARHAKAAPIGRGRVDYLVNRPAEGAHDPVDWLDLDTEQGIVGEPAASLARDFLPDCERRAYSSRRFDSLSRMIGVEQATFIPYF